MAVVDPCYVVTCGYKKKHLRNLVWTEGKSRAAAGTLTFHKFEHIWNPPPTQEMWEPHERPEDWLGPEPETPLGAAGSASAAGADVTGGATLVDPTLMDREERERYDKHVRRIAEEATCRAMLLETDWVYTIKKTEAMEAERLLEQLAEGYIADFLQARTRPTKCEEWPRNLRVWVVEAMWCFDCLQENGWTPKHLEHPHDRHIRADAAEAAVGFTDPGNLVLDDVVHILRLFRYVSNFKYDQLMRVAPNPYGAAGSNKSAKGPVNFRGNIVEALTKDLQYFGSRSQRRQ